MTIFTNNNNKKPNPNYVPPASTKLKKIFCRHKDNEVVCWHWTHGYNTNEIRFLEIQLKCNDCGKYHFIDIRDWDECYKFIEKYKDKQWSDTCKPVL